MTLTIRMKLLLLGVSLVLFALLISIQSYNVLLNNYFISNAKNQIKQTHNDFVLKVNDLNFDLKKSTAVLSMQDDIVPSVTFISKYQDPDKYEHTIFENDKKLIGNSILRHAQSLNLDTLAIYDIEDRLISFFINSKDGDIYGYVSYDNKGNEVFLSYGGQTLSKQNVSLIKEQIINSFKPIQNKSISQLSLADTFLKAESYDLIKIDGKQVGSIYAVKNIDMAVIENIAKKSNLEVAIYNEQNKCICTHDICSKIALNRILSKWNYIKNYYVGKFNFLVNNKERINLYYIMDEKILNKEKNILTKASLIAFIVTLLFALPFMYWFANRYFVNAIDILMKATKKLEKGFGYQIKEKVYGEFKQFVDTFNNMSSNIEKRDRELQEYVKAVDAGSIVSKSSVDGKITYVNDQLCRVTGYSRKELIGKPHSILRHPSVSKQVFKDMWKMLFAKKIYQGVLENKKKDGSSFYARVTIVPILDSNNNIKEFIALRDDVTELVDSKNKLIKSYETDSLTMFGNRFKMQNDLIHIEKPIVTLFNIDYFKEINDFYGTNIGDMLLIKLAKRISSYLKENCQIYRVHADEFAVISSLDEVEYDKYINNMMFIHNIIEKDPFLIEGEELSINITLGISKEKKNILNSASLALKSAKKRKVDYLAYSDELRLGENYKSNLEWSKKLKKAIQSNSIIPYFQPIYNNKTAKIEKYEALIRLIDEDGKVISPFFFLDIAKRTRQYSKLTKIMIDKTFEAFKGLPYEFSINLTMDDISNQDIIEYLNKRKKEFNIDKKLVYELVESEGVNDFEQMKSFFESVKQSGSSIAIDDFGTGYSNFEYLIKLDSDYIKIDGSLIKGINEDKNKYATVETIVEFAKRNNFKTIAEFVSCKEIFDIVNELGIDYSQGFYIGKPEERINTEPLLREE